MMNKEMSTVTRAVLSFQYKGKPIDFEVWQTGSDRPTAVLFLGAAQTGRLAEWVARHCPPSTIVVQGLPHWLVDDEDISIFAIKYTQEAFRAVISHYKLQEASILVESQATPSVIKLFAVEDLKDHLGDLVLVQPLGLNHSIFSSALDPFSLFLSRTAHNAKYQWRQLLDRMFYSNARQLSRHLDLRDPMFRTHYTTGLQQDIALELKKLHDQGERRIAIICGANDKLFAPEEISRTLEQYNIDISIQQIPGIPHSPLTTRQGLKLLRTAFANLK